MADEIKTDDNTCTHPLLDSIESCETTGCNITKRRHEQISNTEKRAYVH